MKTIKHPIVLGIATVALTLLLPLFSGGQAFAQEDDSQTRDARPNEQMPGRADGDLIGRLNLTPDQVKRIREIRQQNAEEMRNTRMRMVRAQRDLDEAIYADSVDEAAAEVHARDLASAQAAVARLRALTELRIRRLLTPEQLSLLREIRQQARERDLENPRGRRQNSAAFQERQRQNAPGQNPNMVKPGTTGTTQSTPPTGARKP